MRGQQPASAMARQEQILLEYVQRLDRYREGRRAVHLHLSRLRPHHRRNHHLRIAATTFDRPIKKFDGGLFRLTNNDMIFMTKGATVADIDEAVLRLRYLFDEDPIMNRGGGSEDRFCTWYDLETDYPAFLAAIEMVAAAARKPAAASESSAAKPEQPPDRPLDSAHLAQMEKALASADLSGQLRRQSICFMLPGGAPKALFQELFFSIADLGRAIMPGFNLLASRWLFQHLTEILDSRMLALLTRRDDPTLATNFSLNLNIATVLAPEFQEFDELLRAGERGAAAIELQQIDVLADLGSFLFARDFLKDNGYRVCLDGLRHFALPLLDRERIGVDLVKVQWGRDLADYAAGDHAMQLKDVVERIGRDRVILCHCDSPDAVRVGAELGITMYQGFYIDALVQDTAMLPGGQTRPRAAS